LDEGWNSSLSVRAMWLMVLLRRLLRRLWRRQCGGSVVQWILLMRQVHSQQIGMRTGDQVAMVAAAFASVLHAASCALI